jgi:hypothetical protein
MRINIFLILMTVLNTAFLDNNQESVIVNDKNHITSFIEENNLSINNQKDSFQNTIPNPVEKTVEGNNTNQNNGNTSPGNASIPSKTNQIKKRLKKGRKKTEKITKRKKTRPMKKKNRVGKRKGPTKSNTPEQENLKKFEGAGTPSSIVEKLDKLENDSSLEQTQKNIVNEIKAAILGKNEDLAIRLIIQLANMDMNEKDKIIVNQIKEEILELFGKKEESIEKSEPKNVPETKELTAEKPFQNELLINKEMKNTFKDTESTIVNNILLRDNGIKDSPVKTEEQKKLSSLDHMSTNLNEPLKIVNLDIQTITNNNPNIINKEDEQKLESKKNSNTETTRKKNLTEEEITKKMEKIAETKKLLKEQEEEKNKKNLKEKLKKEIQDKIDKINNKDKVLNEELSKIISEKKKLEKEGQSIKTFGEETEKKEERTQKIDELNKKIEELKKIENDEYSKTIEEYQRELISNFNNLKKNIDTIVNDLFDTAKIKNISLDETKMHIEKTIEYNIKLIENKSFNKINKNKKKKNADENNKEDGDENNKEDEEKNNKEDAEKKKILGLLHLPLKRHKIDNSYEEPLPKINNTFKEELPNKSHEEKSPKKSINNTDDMLLEKNKKRDMNPIIVKKESFFNKVANLFNSGDFDERLEKEVKKELTNELKTHIGYDEKTEEEQQELDKEIKTKVEEEFNTYLNEFKNKKTNKYEIMKFKNQTPKEQSEEQKKKQVEEDKQQKKEGKQEKKQEEKEEGMFKKIRNFFTSEETTEKKKKDEEKKEQLKKESEEKKPEEKTYSFW